jgi:hypothetical protein
MSIKRRLRVTVRKFSRFSGIPLIVFLSLAGYAATPQSTPDRGLSKEAVRKIRSSTEAVLKTWHIPCIRGHCKDGEVVFAEGFGV